MSHVEILTSPPPRNWLAAAVKAQIAAFEAGSDGLAELLEGLARIESLPLVQDDEAFLHATRAYGARVRELAAEWRDQLGELKASLEG